MGLLTFETSADQLCVRIKDEGNGFDWQPYLEISPSAPHSPNGRGIATSRQAHHSPRSSTSAAATRWSAFRRWTATAPECAVPALRLPPEARVRRVAESRCPAAHGCNAVWVRAGATRCYAENPCPCWYRLGTRLWDGVLPFTLSCSAWKASLSDRSTAFAPPLPDFAGCSGPRKGPGHRNQGRDRARADHSKCAHIFPSLTSCSASIGVLRRDLYRGRGCDKHDQEAN